MQEIEVIIHEVFFFLLRVLFDTSKEILIPQQSRQTAVLPLYGRERGDAQKKLVQEKSGLNQWNAAGRRRDPNEVYIPISRKWHELCPGFFPPRDESFFLLLPNGERMKAKICQDGDKALMSDPNKALGKWLLRDVLDLKEGELLRYDKLERIGIDSVRIDKISDGEYEINFSKAGSYERFEKRMELQSEKTGKMLP